MESPLHIFIENQRNTNTMSSLFHYFKLLLTACFIQYRQFFEAQAFNFKSSPKLPNVQKRVEGFRIGLVNSGNGSKEISVDIIKQEIVQSTSGALIQEAISAVLNIPHDSTSDVLTDTLGNTIHQAAVDGFMRYSKNLLCSLQNETNSDEDSKVKSTQRHQAQRKSRLRYRPYILPEVTNSCEYDNPIPGISEVTMARMLPLTYNVDSDKPPSWIFQDNLSGNENDLFESSFQSPSTPVPPKSNLSVTVSVLRHVILPLITHSLAHTAPSSVVHHAVEGLRHFLDSKSFDH